MITIREFEICQRSAVKQPPHYEDLTQFFFLRGENRVLFALLLVILRLAGAPRQPGEYKMEYVYIYDTTFLDNKTIRLSEESSVSEKEVQLIIIPKKTSKPKRKTGLLKGMIRMSENFNEPLEELREYME